MGEHKVEDIGRDLRFDESAMWAPHEVICMRVQYLCDTTRQDVEERRNMAFLAKNGNDTVFLSTYK